MALELGDVRYWMNSRKHLLTVSFSGFDPDRTSLKKRAVLNHLRRRRRAAIPPRKR
jgi:hypothetical protein